MRSFLRSSLLALTALALTLIPCFAQDQAELSRYAGIYEFEAPDFGVISILVALTEERDALTLTAMDSQPLPLKHLTGQTYELNSPEFGIINVGFLAEDDGSISAMTIDGYDFSFVATKIKSE